MEKSKYLLSQADLAVATSVVYHSANREVEIRLANGSCYSFPVDHLEMVERTELGWVPMTNLSDSQLSKVEIYSGGRYLLWDDLDQIFDIEGLLAGRFGREAWMAQLEKRLMSEAADHSIQNNPA